MRYREYCLEILNNMRIGEVVHFDRSIYYEAFQPDFLGTYALTADDACLNSLVGSAWGAYEIEHNPENGNVRIYRHKEVSVRTYQSADRRHLLSKDDAWRLGYDNRREPFGEHISAYRNHKAQAVNHSIWQERNRPPRKFVEHSLPPSYPHPSAQYAVPTDRGGQSS